MEMPTDEQDKIADLFVIGGGINGCGIARDAAGRGLSVELAEMDDLASATSSASTKLFHGGLRYLEYFEFRLVREALKEREILLRAMPHISWPMRFVLPYHRDMRFEAETPTSQLLNRVMPWMKGRRPAWLIRLGLFLYDHLGGRGILPGTRSVDLRRDPAGGPLQDQYQKAYEYSDCWVQDARLVVLNARDAVARGARIYTRTKVVSAKRIEDHWLIETECRETGARCTRRARALVNAAGPWVMDVIRGVARQETDHGIRLVRGSHIVTKRLFDHDRCYFFQGSDGRIIFAIPYETDFTLIGTTDAEHPDTVTTPVCSDEEVEYLCRFASEYFSKPITREDVVWTYSGVRPLYDDGASSATAATREYVLKLNAPDGQAPLLNVFGGKITTYRKLAEAAMGKLAPLIDGDTAGWTAGVALPGGDFEVEGGVVRLTGELQQQYPFLEPSQVLRLIRAYGTEAWNILGSATAYAGLGQDFGAGLCENEVRWMMQREYARNAQDVLWRRSKLGLHLTEEQAATLEAWMQEEQYKNEEG